ncbi:hypothetical protein GO003_024025 [Methylicorpusculum oleiharenae]|jgi:hypothetical protein|uniref:hypothetical protein n=1 Tax=Methylicorpusculum oleiharenae TaxID=1338687 RepID=UPI001357E3F8|nr:hypothetical protein [Methylicorpusculum oleiharenae]MCD2453453.1 hypothetical protein [Methylicorpusculum oleiharenae]
MKNTFFYIKIIFIILIISNKVLAERAWEGDNDAVLNPSEKIDPQPISNYPLDYATILTSNFLGGRVCNNLKAFIFNIANGKLPDNIKIMQIDKVYDKADRVRCARY